MQALRNPVGLTLGRPRHLLVPARELFVPKRPAVIIPFPLGNKRDTLAPAAPRATRFSPLFPGPGALLTTFKGNNAANNVAQATWNFTSSDFGSAADNRYIFVSWYAHNGANLTLNSAAIGGVNATIETQSGTLNQTDGCAGIVFALVPTGTSGTIGFTWSGNFTASTSNGMGISWYTVYGAVNTTASDTYNDNSTTTPRSKTFSVPAGGFALVSGASNNVNNAMTGDFTADRNFVTDVAGRNSWRGSVTNALATAANKAFTATSWSASSANSPLMGRAYGHN